MKSVRTIILPVAFAGVFLLGFILRGLLVTPAAPSPTTADHAFVSGNYTVTRVLDGDTIEVAGGTRIRYEGIDAPELHERYGTAAYGLNKELVSGKTIRVELGQEKSDVYGRSLGYVYVGNTFVNKKMIEEGYATVLAYDKMKKPEFYDEFLAMQEEARASHRGMWVREWK